MSLATLESLTLGMINYDDIMINFGKWYYKDEFTPTGEMFDVGNTCSYAIDNYFAHKKPVNLCGLTKENSNGNGSLMRIHPTEMKIVSKLFSDHKYNIYYFGVSKGGLIGCWYGADNPNIKRFVSVNAPLMINFFNKTKPALEKLKEKVVMVYGKLDPSYRYTPFLEGVADYKMVEGADHYFKGKMCEFENSIDEYLLFDLKQTNIAK